MTNALMLDQAVALLLKLPKKQRKQVAAQLMERQPARSHGANKWRSVPSGVGSLFDKSLFCGNCHRFADEHCAIHKYPCCPGKCPKEICEKRD